MILDVGYEYQKALAFQKLTPLTKFSQWPLSKMGEMKPYCFVILNMIFHHEYTNMLIWVDDL